MTRWHSKTDMKWQESTFSTKWKMIPFIHPFPILWLMAVVGRLSFADAPLNQAFVSQLKCGSLKCYIFDKETTNQDQTATYHWLMLGGVLVYVLATCCHPPLVAMDAEHDGAGGRPCGARWAAGGGGEGSCGAWRAGAGIGSITVMQQLIRLTSRHPIRTCFVKYTLYLFLSFSVSLSLSSSSQNRLHQEVRSLSDKGLVPSLTGCSNSTLVFVSAIGCLISGLRWTHVMFAQITSQSILSGIDVVFR